MDNTFQLVGMKSSAYARTPLTTLSAAISHTHTKMMMQKQQNIVKVYY